MEFKKEIKYILILTGLFIIQSLMIYNDFELSYPSDDIVFYGKAAQDLIHFKQENTSGILNELYPALFNGTNNYHYFELWLTGFIGNVFNLSYGYTLYFIVYPLLLFIYFLLLLSLTQFFLTKSDYLALIVTLVLFFVGPVYLSFYKEIFNDGNMIGTTIFTIPGFNLNSLPFSYYGQKHLTTYIFLLSSLIFYFHQHQKLFILFASFAAIASFGVFIGVFGGLYGIILFNKPFRSKENIVLFIMVSLFIIGFYQITNQPIMSSIKTNTLYFNDFGKHLNFKGEIARVFGKIFIPFLWYSILFLPFIFPLFLSKTLRNMLLCIEHKVLISFVLFCFIAASLFTTVVQGLNSDQFLTNLLPLFNLIIILLMLFYFRNFNLIRFKIILLIPIIGIFLNVFHTVKQHQTTHLSLNNLHSTEFIQKVTNVIKNTDVKIGYLLSNKIVNHFPPINWYPYRPGKCFVLTNGLNQFINLNYPFTHYKKSSSSIAYSSENQMKYFIGDSVSFDHFDNYQKDFVFKNRIKYFFISDKNSIPTWFNDYNHEKIEDVKSGIYFIVLKQ